MEVEVGIKTDRVQKFVKELESQKAIISTCTELFTTLSNHFNSLQESISSRSNLLDTKRQSLESDARQTLESLSQQESSIPDRESAALTLIAEKKQVAITEIDKRVPADADLAENVRAFVRKMDWSGLLKFINTKRKESHRLRSELPGLIAEAIDPPRLVLDAVEEFVMKSGPTDKRWSCEMLVHALFHEASLNSKAKGATLMPEFASSVSERAENLLQLWKGNTDSGAGGGGFGPAEAVMFLELTVIFKLASKFDEEFLKKLVLDFASRRDVAKLATELGFGDMAGIIEELVKRGKEIEAVHFTTESGLTDRFPPVSLLKSYLRNSKKNATNILKNGNNSATATEESNNVELSSIKAVLKCVEDLKLEVEFPLENLRKRALTLDKAKAQKKKSSAPPANPSKSSSGNKRPFGGSGGGGGGSRGGRGGGQPPRPAKAARYAPPNHQSYAARASNLSSVPPPNQSSAPRHSGPHYSSLAYNPYEAAVNVNKYEPSVAAKYDLSYSVPHNLSNYGNSASASVSYDHQQQYSPIVDRSGATAAAYAAVAAAIGGAGGGGLRSAVGGAGAGGTGVGLRSAVSGGAGGGGTGVGLRSPLYSHGTYDYASYSPTEPNFSYPQQQQ